MPLVIDNQTFTLKDFRWSQLLPLEEHFNSFIRSLFYLDIFNKHGLVSTIFSELRNFIIDSSDTVYPISAHTTRPYTSQSCINQVEHIMRPVSNYFLCYKNGFYIAPEFSDKMLLAQIIHDSLRRYLLYKRVVIMHKFLPFI